MTTAELLTHIGRIVFGGFFLIAGIRNFLHFRERTELSTNYGWRLPAVLVAVGFAMQLVGGVSLIFNLHAATGAGLLIVFLVVATSLYHNFFMFQGKERDPHLYLTLVNITLAGGLLMIIADAL
ncbi:DoxX family protein [Mesorhizobium sp. ASY16-5R]|uniref:DoxX family protein n=1 Tax=Mesorhizobium sp. ASY16-5R TaxID=3445772 RepID=UPI003FA141A5